MSGAAIAAVAGPIVGGVIGNIASAGDRAAAMDAVQKAYQQFANLDIPDTEKMKLALETPEVQGVIAPYLEQAVQQGPSAMEDIAIDPRLKQAQMSALDTLSKMGQTGLTSADRASLNEIRRAGAGEEQARQNQILQSMQQRGVGGSGVELAAKLASSQQQADRSSVQADSLAKMGQERMLEAITQSGQLGGSIRAQDYGEQQNLAGAKDQIARFNAQQSGDVNARNIALQNAAQQKNLSEKQRTYEQAIGTRNMQQQFNKNLAQQEFDNRMSKAAGVAGQLGNVGKAYSDKAAATAAMWSQIGGAAGQAGAGMAGSGSSGSETAALTKKK